MRVIFLDIDGVVCTMRALNKAYARWFGIPTDNLQFEPFHLDDRVSKAIDERRKKKIGKPDFNMDHWPFDEEAVDLIHRIVRENTDIKFVISSTWRKGETIKSLDEKFRLKGLQIPIIGFTEVTYNGRRGQEIQMWLDFNKDTYNVTHFCAIDDEVYDIINKIPDNCVETNFDFGFTEVEYNKVMKILGGPQWTALDEESEPSGSLEL